jgi:PAS domain S-box-containing protein
MIFTEAALKRLHEPARLEWIANLKRNADRERKRLELITKTAARLFDLPLVSLNLIEASQQVTFTGVGVEVGAVEELNRSLCAHVVAHNTPLMVPDTLRDPRLTHHPAIHGFSPTMRCYFGVPLHAPGGAAVGTLAVAGFQPRRFDTEVEQLRGLATWIESEWARDHYAQRMEEERATAERLSTITRSITDGVLVFDRQGIVIHANALAAFHMGASGELTPGVNLLEAIPAGPALNAVRWIIQQGPPQVPLRNDLILPNAHGRPTPVEVTTSATGDGEWFVAIGHDVSERVLHEQALAGLSARFESILDAAADAIVRVNNRGLIEYANTAMGKLLGVPRSSLLGVNLHSHYHQFLPDGSHYAWHDCPTHRAMRSSESIHELEEVYWRADGTPIAVAYSVTPVSNPADDTYTGAVMVMRDIEARKRLERLKSAFIANVSHELRTPLTAIKGSLALLLGGAVGDVNPEQRSLLDVAHASTDRLVRLVNDLLDLGRLDAARLILHKRRVNLGSLVQTALEGIAVPAANARIRIETTVAADAGPWLDVDPDRIVQILTNLLANAIAFSPNGSRVRVSAQVQRREVRITVRDWGSGIPPEARETIFDRFVQADTQDRRAYGGTGLGLAIARQLAHAHGGRLGLGHARIGSVFHLWLPLPTPRGGE